MSLASHCASCGAPLNTGMQCSRSCHVTRGLVAAPRLVPVSSIKWSSDGEWISRLEADVARLTHRVAQLEAQLAEARADVARLTTETTEAKDERDKFREWFQNAEQARAVAESRLETVEAMREHYKADAIGCASQVVELQRVREQAIQDIEALPQFLGCFSAGSDCLLSPKHADGYVLRDSVLLILREAPTNG